ncbi:PHP-associated domain-containing protein [Halobaculum litoreum]|uniref:PHP-associated domain-containing protein n=1 Tax=Halobaculum litoreum TaxID=3031998 RepID=A0ABD5XR72_9EURY|nr:PHP-associated domain-containing protein [Halobaculum sp. DT92]
MPTFAVDLHSHSRFFHGFAGRATAYDRLGVRLQTAAARRRGLDALAVTNHDYAYPTETAFPTLPGIEVSTTRGHVLIVGPDPPARTTPGELTPGEAVAVAHERDCAAVLAHPYRGSTARRSGAAFDAVEINGKNPEHAARTRRLAARLDVPLVGGSDAHYPVEVGRAYTRVTVDGDAPTPRAVADAIRAGRTEPVLRYDGLQRVIDRAYTAVHAWRGRASRE